MVFESKTSHSLSGLCLRWHPDKHFVSRHVGSFEHLIKSTVDVLVLRVVPRSEFQLDRVSSQEDGKPEKNERNIYKNLVKLHLIKAFISRRLVVVPGQ